MAENRNQSMPTRDALREAMEKMGQEFYVRRARSKEAREALKAIEYLEREGVQL